jgi:hypothetical protein
MRMDEMYNSLPSTSPPFWQYLSFITRSGFIFMEQDEINGTEIFLFIASRSEEQGWEWPQNQSWYQNRYRFLHRRCLPLATSHVGRCQKSVKCFVCSRRLPSPTTTMTARPWPLRPRGQSEKCKPICRGSIL